MNNFIDDPTSVHLRQAELCVAVEAWLQTMEMIPQTCKVSSVSAPSGLFEGFLDEELPKVLTVTCISPKQWQFEQKMGIEHLAAAVSAHLGEGVEARSSHLEISMSFKRLQS